MFACSVHLTHKLPGLLIIFLLEKILKCTHKYSLPLPKFLPSISQLLVNILYPMSWMKQLIASVVILHSTHETVSVGYWFSTLNTTLRITDTFSFSNTFHVFTATFYHLENLFCLLAASVSLDITWGNYLLKYVFRIKTRMLI